MVEALIAIQIVTQIFLFLVAAHWLNERFEDFKASLDELTSTFRQYTEGNNINASDNRAVSYTDGNSKDDPFVFVDDETKIFARLRTFVREVMGGKKVKQL
jgi:hypothetical protein